MAAAARAAAERGVWAMCGYTYRRTPALALANGWSMQAGSATVRHVRAQYLQDWLTIRRPDDLAAGQDQIRLRGTGRPRRPPHRHRPVAHRHSITGVSGDHGDVCDFPAAQW